MKLRLDSIYKALFEATNEGIFVHHAKTGEILVVNKGAERLFKCSKEELLAGSVDKFSLGEPPYSSKEAMYFIKKAATEGPQRFEWLSRTAKSELFWTEISLTHTVINGLGVVIAMVRDISRQKDLEKRLSLSEARYRTLFEFMADGVAVYRAVDHGEDFEFVDFNRAAERIEKINRSNVIGKRLSEVFPGVEEFGFLEILRKVYKTGVSMHYPAKLYTDNRISGWRENYVYKLPSGEIVAVYQDRTQEIQAKEALKERTEFLDSLMDSMPTGVVVATLDRKIQWVSRKFEEITGYSLDELKGSDTRILYASDQEYERAGAAYSLLERGREADLEAVWQTKSGKEIDVLLRGTKIKTVQGESVLVTVLDITNLKQMEKERLEMEKRLSDVQRLESLGLIAGGVAHDFNNILMGIMGNAELAVLRSQDMAQASYLKSIIKACQKASQLCNQLLSYAGRGEVRPQIVDVNQTIKGMEEFLRFSISKNATLHLKLAHTLPKVEIDPAQLEQVVMNLVINASEAIEQKLEDPKARGVKGEITISTDVLPKERSCAEDYADANTNSDEKTFVTITVVDNGCGMDAETKKRIFDPFFTTKFFGRGLGMANVLGIIRQNGGCIHVDTKEGHGTTVRVGIPVSRTAASERTASVHTPMEKGCEKLPQKPVLLIDDEPGIVAVAVELIAAIGLESVACSSGLEAMSLMEKGPDKFSCVICDLTMPGMSGRETIIEIQRLNPHIPIIVTSGLSRQQVVDELEGVKVADFLQKPYSLEELKKALKRINK